MPRAEAQQLVADGGDDRDQQDPARDHDQRRLAADQAERQDREQDHHHQELRAAARVGGGVLADVLRAERLAGLEGVDRHVLGAVVLEHAVDVRRAADHEQVADEDHDPRQALDEVLDQAFSMFCAVNVATISGRMKNRPMPRIAVMPEHERDAALADLDALVLGLEAGAADQPAGADDQRLVEHDQAAHERPLGGRLAVDTPTSRRSCS